MPERSFLRPLVPAIGWAAVVMLLCGIPGSDLPDLTFLQWLRPDKIVHLFMFGILNFLLIKGFEKQLFFMVPGHSAKIYATVISILYGILTEILQATVFINRQGDVRDALADALGAFCGIWAVALLEKRKRASV